MKILMKSSENIAHFMGRN